ncbi:MAG: hypothetical protein ABEK50_10550 [bacterium]
MAVSRSEFEDERLKNKLIWDYEISMNEFEDFLFGRKEEGWFDQKWALSRAINHLNYYELRRLVPLQLLSEHWDRVSDQIRDPAVKKGLEFLLRRRILSSSG